MSQDKLRESIARELLTVLSMKGTPDIIALDCRIKKKYASPDRPWPFSDALDAATTFQKVASEGQKKYAGVKVSVDKNILRLSLD